MTRSDKQSESLCSYVNSLSKLIQWIETNHYKGYDIYDGLNSPILDRVSNKYLRIAALQLNKFSPINLRPLLKIEKDYSPKGMALFLQAYSLLAQNKSLIDLRPNVLKGIDMSFRWLKENAIKKGNGLCWAINFPVTSFGKDRPRNDPSSVLACFVGEGLYEYYRFSGDEEALDMMRKTSVFIEENIPVTAENYGICYSYTTTRKDVVFNANMHVAEFYSKLFALTNDEFYRDKAKQCVNFCIEHQKDDGRWVYSVTEDGKERHQYDFHQAFILCSLHDYITLCDDGREVLLGSLERGLSFYDKKLISGPTTIWRYPIKYPIDIHNQAMSIILHSKLESSFQECKQIAQSTLSWTVSNMQDASGYFYAHRYPFITNKTPFIRWSQAWMLLAFARYLEELIELDMVTH